VGVPNLFLWQVLSRWSYLVASLVRKQLKCQELSKKNSLDVSESQRCYLAEILVLVKSDRSVSRNTDRERILDTWLRTPDAPPKSTCL